MSGFEYILYAFNSPYFGKGQKLVIRGCSFVHITETAAIRIDDVAYSCFRSKSTLVIIATNNTFSGVTSSIHFIKNTYDGEIVDYIPNGDNNIVLSMDNRNNDIIGLERE